MHSDSNVEKEAVDDLALYCIDCGALLSRSDDRCYCCGEYQ